MNIKVTQLNQNSQLIFPQTSAEAVLVKQGSVILTLDKVLNRKSGIIITPDNSGLNIEQNNDNTVSIKHSNPNIIPNNSPEPLQIQYDIKGHIINTEPMKKLKVLVNDKSLIETNGAEEKTLEFGNNFGIDSNNKINLKWNDINVTT